MSDLTKLPVSVEEFSRRFLKPAQDEIALRRVLRALIDYDIPALVFVYDGVELSYAERDKDSYWATVRLHGSSEAPTLFVVEADPVDDASKLAREMVAQMAKVGAQLNG